MAGRTVLVVGGTRGIGEAVARRLGAAGDVVGIAARSADACEQVAQKACSDGAEARAVPFDATVPEQVSAAIASFVGDGALDALVVTCGAAGPTAGVGSLPVTDWHATIRSNLSSAFLCAQASVTALAASGDGRMVFFGAIGAHTGMPNRVAYCAAKAGLVGLTRSLARELGPRGITVNCVSPGSTQGPRLDEVLAPQAERANVSLEKMRATIARSAALNRLVNADDVAGVVELLLGSAGNSITGQEINVNAGAHFG